MRKLLVTFMAPLLSCTAAFAFWPEAADSSFELGVGYRNDKLSWEHHASETAEQNPSAVITKQQWKNVNIWQIGANFKYVTCDNLYLRAAADYGWVTSGKVTHYDYVSANSSSSSSSSSGDSLLFADNQCPFDNFSHKANKGHVYDADIAVGYEFKMCDDGLSLAPVVGYSWNGQHFGKGSNNGSSSSSSSSSSISNVVVAALASSDVSGNGSDGKFHARWNGPFLGLDLNYKMWCDWAVFGSYEFHWARYNAKVSQFGSSLYNDRFTQRAKNGHGQVASIGVKYDFCECWTVSLVGEWSWFRAEKGRSKIFTDAGNGSSSEFNSSSSSSNGGGVETRCFVSAPVTHVIWQSASATVNVGMLF